MLDFQARGQVTFAYHARFVTQPYANISFFAENGVDIPFHLSLRFDQGRAVVNRRVGSDWKREIGRNVTLAREGALVEIRFGAPGLKVLIDGRKIFAFSGRGLSRFTGLSRIETADFQGGIAVADIRIRLPEAPVPSRPEITPRLELRGRMAGPGPFTLSASGGGVDLPVIAEPETGSDTGKFAVRAVLPGRLWQDVPEGAGLELALKNAGGAAPVTLRLSRAEAAAQVARATEQISLVQDGFAAMQLIEHVHYGALGDLLPESAWRGLVRAAQFYRLTKYLPARGSGEILPDTTAGEARDAEGAQLRAAQGAAIDALAEDAQADFAPLLTSVPEALRPTLVLSLVEQAVRLNRVEALWAAAKASGVPSYLPKEGDVWQNSTMLPFLLLEGRFETLVEECWPLGAYEGTDWITTPAVAWCLYQALYRPDLREQDREAVIYGFVGVVEGQARDYWGRAGCAELTWACVALVGEMDRLAGYLQERVVAFILKSKGLSRAFWEGIAERKVALPGALRPAQEAFATISRAADGTEVPAERLREALMLFERAGHPDAPQTRREVLGPSGLAGLDQSLTLANFAFAGLPPEEPALRHMAAPGASDLPQGLRQAARDAIISRYDKVPQAPYRDLQFRAGRLAHGLYARLAAGGRAPEASEIADLAPMLARLMGSRSHGVGLGLGLSLVGGLARLDDTDAAHDLLDVIEAQYRGFATDSQTLLMTLPAPALALDQLARDAARQDRAPILRALDLFGQAPAADPGPAPWAGSSPLFDTLVTVFSCEPNLTTRIPPMRAGWLRLLTGLGVPYVIITGNGDGTLRGDVLALDAPDDYEGLPQKTLATAEWVARNTSFARMLKIDDDCFLNPGGFFYELSAQKFDYYGRPLTRLTGQMDRAWHCAKSTSERGRLEFDKSPEPSTYADGGSGYVLSRRAMEALTEARQTPEGQLLERASFMEDKLVGDLLSLRGIAIEGEDYRISIRRRTFGAAEPVSLWENGFDASRSAPVKLVHLDTDRDQPASVEKLGSDALTPKKIWPSYAPVKLGYQSNALDLIAPQSRLEAARRAPVAVVACLRNERFMLPHFLEHYRRMGTQAFLIADNASDDGTREYLLEQPDVALFSVDTDYSESHYGVAWQQALLSHYRLGQWSLVADADELLVADLEGRQSWDEILADPALEGADGVRLFMLDMYPEGTLDQVTFDSGDPFAEAGFVDRDPLVTNWPGQGPFSNMPTYTSALRHRLIPGSRRDLFVAQKIALLRYRPWMRLSAGLHFIGDVTLARREMVLAHFKYTAQFNAKARAEVARGQHFNSAEEYRKYLALVSEGRDRIFDPAVSVPWRDCAFVRRVLGAAEG